MKNAIIENKDNYLIIRAEEGYKLHEISRDEIIVDEDGNKQIVLGYTKGIVTVFPEYDFEANSREIYAVKDVNGNDEI